MIKNMDHYIIKMWVKKNYIRKFWTVDQEGKEKIMNYGSAFDEKRGWGKTEGKNMDQNFIKMWVKKKIWTMDQLSMKKVGEERRKEKKEKEKSR